MISARCNTCRRMIRTGNHELVRHLVPCSFNWSNTCNQCFTIEDLQNELQRRSTDENSYENFVKMLPKIILLKKIRGENNADNNQKM